MQYFTVEDNYSVRVYPRGRTEPVAELVHDEYFPVLNEEGYKHEFFTGDDGEEEEVGLSYDGCPVGYVIVIIKRRGRTFCLLYGPDGFMGSFADIATARNAASDDDDLRRASGFRK